MDGTGQRTGTKTEGKWHILWHQNNLFWCPKVPLLSIKCRTPAHQNKLFWSEKILHLRWRCRTLSKQVSYTLHANRSPVAVDSDTLQRSQMSVVVAPLADSP